MWPPHCWAWQADHPDIGLGRSRKPNPFHKLKSTRCWLRRLALQKGRKLAREPKVGFLWQRERPSGQFWGRQKTCRTMMGWKHAGFTMGSLLREDIHCHRTTYGGTYLLEAGAWLRFQASNFVPIFPSVTAIRIGGRKEARLMWCVRDARVAFPEFCIICKPS